MANMYMNFNTNTKFWEHLQVEGISNSTTAPDASGYIAYDDVSNNGLISIGIIKEGTQNYEWKPIVHEVKAGIAGDGTVNQVGGVVTVNFPSSGSGNCTKKTIVANVNATNSSDPNIIISLPNNFDDASSFLMTTVYRINDKGGIEATEHPEVNVVKNDNEYGVKFTFGDISQVQHKFKIMILFDQVADITDSSVYNNGNSVWSLSVAENNIPTRTPDTKNKNTQGE